jgi:hypothetical protein
MAEQETSYNRCRSPLGGKDDVSYSSAVNSSSINANNNSIQSGNFKRPASPPSRDPRKYVKQASSIQTDNRFGVLPVDVSGPSQMEAQHTETAVNKRPPPIFVDNIRSYPDFVNQLSIVSEGSQFKCKSNLNNIAVYASSVELYRKLVHYFKSSGYDFHCFQLQEDRPHRLVIRGLHFSTPADTIKDELQQKGFQVRNVVNIISRFKVPLPMFFVDLEPRSDFAELYKLDYLLHSVVKVEDVRRRFSTVQCTRCQSYNHSKSYCGHPPRCVKCAGPHLSSECTRPRDAVPTCALCSKPHTANYRGCDTYQSLQRQRLRISNKNGHSARENLNVSAPTLDGGSFPPLPDTVASASHFSPQHRMQAPSRTANINEHSSLDHATLINNYESRTNNTYNVHRPNLRSYSSALKEQHSPVVDTSLTTIMSSFLNDIKSLILPVISLLTQLTQALLPQNAK